LNPEHLTIIQKVAETIAPRYTFGYLGKEDLIQEAIIFGIEVYDKWDGHRPLENFVSVHISNRLKNFKRDNYFRLGLEDSPQKRQQANDTKKKLMSAGPIKNDPLFFESIDNADEISFLLETLPPFLRNDFLRMANNVTITKKRREAVYEAVKEILGEDR